MAINTKDMRTLRAYFETTQKWLDIYPEINNTQINTFLAIAMWGPQDKHGEPVLLDEIAKRTGKAPTTISEHTRQLGVHPYRGGKVGAGLVTSEDYVLDRRRKVLRLTPTGTRLVEQLVYALEGASGVINNDHKTD